MVYKVYYQFIPKFVIFYLKKRENGFPDAIIINFYSITNI